MTNNTTAPDLIERLRHPIGGMRPTLTDGRAAADALEAAQAEIQRCHERLEIVSEYRMRDENSGLERVEIPYEERQQQTDGIECRDATIALLEQSNKAAQARIAELEGALASCRQSAIWTPYHPACKTVIETVNAALQEGKE